VTFSQAVTGVDATDFFVTTFNVDGAAVTNITGSGTTYTVTVGTGTGDGTPRPDSMALLAARISPPERAVCPGSLALSRAGGRLYAAWWRVRSDSGALLLAAHSADEGRSWSAPA
jgi:hypothetical protein